MSIVGVYAVSHVPGLVAWRDVPPAEETDELYGAYDEVASRIAAAEPDVVLVVTSEHFMNFFEVIPSFFLNIGEASTGPEENWIGVPWRKIIGAPALGRGLLDHCYTAGVDLAWGRSCLLDHATIAPLELLRLAPTTPTLVMLMNALVSPMPTHERCWEVGATVGRYLEAAPERVVVIGAGGLSHWPGMAEAGLTSPSWDKAVLEGVGIGDWSVLRHPPSIGAETAGPGSAELRCWTVVAGCIPPRSADILAYGSVEAWAAGIAVVDLAPDLSRRHRASVS
jgi:hypothetical protein